MDNNSKVEKLKTFLLNQNIRNKNFKIGTDLDDKIKNLSIL